MKNSHWLLILLFVQLLVCYQILPTFAKPFDIYHEDLLIYLNVMTFFIVKAIEDKKSHNELNVYIDKDE